MHGAIVKRQFERLQDFAGALVLGQRNQREGARAIGRQGDYLLRAASRRQLRLQP